MHSYELKQKEDEREGGLGIKDKSLVYILGGGKSAEPIIPHIQLIRQQGYVLGLNRAVIHVDCDGVFALDKQFERESPEIWQKYKDANECHVCYANRNEKNPEKGKTLWTRFHGKDPTYDPTTLENGLQGGVNCGLTAILWALKVGAKVIVLLGFDMTLNTEAWYPLELGVPNQRFNQPKILKNYDHCAPIFKKLWPDSRILNTNKNSEVKCFDYIDLEGIYDRHSLFAG